MDFICRYAEKVLVLGEMPSSCLLYTSIEADFCNTGKEGLQKLKEQEYQLVVLDVICLLYTSVTKGRSLPITPESSAVSLPTSPTKRDWL